MGLEVTELRQGLGLWMIGRLVKGWLLASLAAVVPSPMQPPPPSPPCHQLVLLTVDLEVGGMGLD